MANCDSATTDSSSRPWESYHTVYTNAKAGMEGVDKEKVQRIVYEMSKGSKYFEHEERQEAYLRQKIENMQSHFGKLSAEDISNYQKIAEKRITELEATRDLSRIWLHVDMDAFYAAVETLSNPSLKEKPMAVGGMSMISTANYEARKYGVRAAMPGFIACKLCPELIFVPTDFEKYTYYSSLTRKVFQRYDDNFMAASLDEAYLDITEICKERGLSGAEIAEELRKSVFEETGLTCSAGVAPNRLLAKVCSDINKPNGQFVLPNDKFAVMTFISSLPVRKIGGIGKVTERILKNVLGISSCEDILQKSSLLYALFSHSSADFFLSVGLGLGKTDMPEARSRKSMSSERTFSATNNEGLLYQKLAELADMLSSDLQKEGISGRTLTLKLKSASFEVRTRAVTLPNYIHSREDILRHASTLLKAELPLSIRLIGLRISHFDEGKDGPADPTQKSIKSFVISRATMRNNIAETNSLGSGSNYNLVDAENNHNSGNDIQDCSMKDILDIYQHQDSGQNQCSLKDVMETEKDKAPLEVISTEKTESILHESITQQVETNVSPGKSVNKTTNLLHDAISASNEQDHTLLWVDEYKCSICGFELPPSFVEERQEHSDFHHAERLQRQFELPCNDSTNQVSKRRSVQQDQSQSRRKRQKSSPGKGKGQYLPIDLFFR